MALIPASSSCLDLTISMPGCFASSSSPPTSLPSSGEKSGVCMMRDLDINQVPTTGDQEEHEQEEWMMMMSSTGGGGGGVSILELDEEESSNGGPPRKKLRLTKEQSRLLEESFRQNHTLNTKQKEALAMELKLRPRQVEVWFQNRRARSKLKQTEMECEYLKRWFGSLTEQNRRLQREVEELRAMKVGPPTVFSPHSCEPLPASTLTMCPGCERVTTATVLDKKDRTRSCSTATLSAKAPLQYHS